MRILKTGLFAGLTLLCASAQAAGPNSAGHAIVVDLAADSTAGDCCARPSGRCNLRAALTEAARRHGDTTIELRVDPAITLGEIVVNAGHGISLRGNGHAITGNKFSRLFTIGSGARLTIEGTTVTNFSAFSGGAIVNQGDLTIAHSTFRGNTAECSGVGAMTAFADCDSGAIASTGKLTLGDDALFDGNAVHASASTASFTNASAIGGAISSSGTLIIDGSAIFQNNAAVATANSGIHPMPAGGATASASGGGIASSGALTVTDHAKGRCAFINNQASATGSTVQGSVTLDSHGGGIATSGGQVDGLPAGCVFQGNSAQLQPDFSTP